MLPIDQLRPRLVRRKSKTATYFVEALEARTLLSVFNVTNTGDNGGVDPAVGAGTGTLRQAIVDANANPGLDTIDFNIPAGGLQTIAPESGLPKIKDPVIIDGTTESGYAGTPIIELDGTNAGNSSGLEFTVGGNTVMGLDIHSFGFDGILFAEPNGATATGGNTVLYNYIGTDPSGKVAEGNVEGVHLIYSPNDVIEDNLLSGNKESGIFVADKYSTGTIIEANYIGTDSTGLAPLGNGLDGVALGAPPVPAAGDGFASGNFVGGTNPDQRNIISGNGASGVWIEGGSNNVVEGNYIGVGIDGKTALGNGTLGAAAPEDYGAEGVFINSGSNNEIGGTSLGAGNVISANFNNGVVIDVLGNVQQDADNNTIQGNKIGTDLNGNAGTKLGNQSGIQVRNDSGSTLNVLNTYIGGNDADDGTVDGKVNARNVISGNQIDGIVIAGNVQLTNIKGNIIGADATGQNPVPNGSDGIAIGAIPALSTSPKNTLIGGIEAGAANVISGNTLDGIYIQGASAVAIADDNIGTNFTATTQLSNGLDGVDIVDSTLIYVGGTGGLETVPAGADQGNYIDTNGSNGVEISGGSTFVQVAGNLITGNTGNGVVVSDSSENTIGGSGGPNTISGNTLNGVEISGQNASLNIVQGNTIGLETDGVTPSANGGDGVLIAGGTTNTIGGDTTDAANTISSNKASGVEIYGSTAIANVVIGNTIGLDSGDTAMKPNLNGGVVVDGGASNNIIGDATSTGYNIIAGNMAGGIFISEGDGGNQIINNFIGENADSAAFPNTGFGIAIFNSANNVIGGNTPEAGNAIDDTAVDPNAAAGILTGIGVSISGADATGNVLIGNHVDGNAATGIRIGEGASKNTIGGTITEDQNFIGTNVRGVSVEDGAHDNTIIGNLIGTDDNGSFVEGDGNSSDGITFDNVGNNSAINNAIRGNLNGIDIDGASGTNNVVTGNAITNNTSSGVIIQTSASNNTVGGPNDTDRNIISINSEYGVYVTLGCHDNQIIGNYIGTDYDGNFDENFGNGFAGVALSNASSNTVQANTIRGNEVGIGMDGVNGQQNHVIANIITNSLLNGITLINGANNNFIGSGDDHNLISMNHGDGIYVDALSASNSIIGNYIGTDSGGLFTQGAGNVSDGVELLSGGNTLQGNTIRGNVNGIDIHGAAATGNIILGNIITDNDTRGIDITQNASNTQIGGTNSGNGNQISQNAGAGIYIDSGTGNAIRENDIFGNGALGIDLYPVGVTPNDPQSALDADTGANNLQNYPILTMATTGGSNRIVGTLDSAASTTFILDFFNLGSPDPSGFGQGDTFLKTVNVTTNASGVANFDVPLPDGSVIAGSFISATATDPGGNTSEFSNAVVVEQDTDGDGIGDNTEGGAPGNGDANNDGIPDSQQDNVASFKDYLTGQYVTIQSPAGTVLTDVTPLPNPSPNDEPDASFNLGFFSFTVSGVTPGGSVAIKVLLPADSNPPGYYRYGPVPGDQNPQWYSWNYNGQTGAELGGNQITLHFVDGQLGDDDGLANGTIVDAGGPAFPPQFTVTNTNDSGPGSLRQAILNSNANPGNEFTNLINFDIGSGGVQTIMPLSDLPIITAPVTIDGTTQPGFAGKPIIEIDGASAPDGAFQVNAGDTTIRGLVINRFPGTAITTYQNGFQVPYDFQIVGNYIGTDVTGTVAEGNGNGILVYGGDGTIGGAALADRNVISDNSSNGIVVLRDYWLTIEGNLIGVAADGASPLGNGGDGVYLGDIFSPSSRVQEVTIGGLDPGDGNVIAFNTYDGIEDDSSNGTFEGADNTYLSNSIYANAYLGISDNPGFGQDVNDSGENDGSGSSQNYPVLSSALSAGGQTTISGYLNSLADESFTIQFFSNPTVTPNGFGQGETYLGSTTVTTDNNGHADFTTSLNVSVANGQLMTATATSAAGDTSEFSMRLAVGDVLGNVYVVNTTDDTDDGAINPAHMTLRDAIFAADNHPGLDTIEFDIGGGGVQTIAPLTPLPPITDSVIIDGTTQPGYAGTPLIQLVGTQEERTDLSASPSLLTGLNVSANGCTIKGLDLNSFFYNPGLGAGADRLGLALVVTGNNNLIEGNFIGTDPTGTVELPNATGILVNGDDNQIGGTTAAQRNIISANVDHGINLFGTGNLIEGNFIGTDITGAIAFTNGRVSPVDDVNGLGYGVSEGYGAIRIEGHDNTIGGSSPGAGNLISGNYLGIDMYNGDGSVIQGNYIGTDVSGTKLIGNKGIGIADSYAENAVPAVGVTIGGSAPGEGNIISGNAYGIVGYSAFYDTIQGNLIGTDVTGTRNFGNQFAGIYISGPGIVIGGAAPGAGNVISGNGGNGIDLGEESETLTTGDTIQGNRIGTAADGVTPMGNGLDGILVSSDDALIGGTDSGEANTIAYNGKVGVEVHRGLGTGILSNVIYANKALGIDLDANGLPGVTLNDPGDVDTGPNGLQNFPVLATAVTDGTSTTITGSINSTPDTFFTLQFFVNPSADPSGYGQGQTLLGTRQLTTDSGGNATFTLTFPLAVPVGQFISATATDVQNNTSEFSLDLQMTSGAVAPNQPPTVSVGGPYTINEGDSLTLDASHSADPDGDPLTYTWDVNGDGVFGDATGVKPTLTWTQLQALGIVNGPSSFSVQVRIDDGHGHVVTSPLTTLTVLNVPPTAIIIGNQGDLYVNEEDTVSLSGTFTDPGTADTHTFDWHVDADNGQVIADGTDENFSFVPDDGGAYTVTFTVTDSDGGVGTDTEYVYAQDVPPVVTIIGTPAQGTVGVPIQLTSSVKDVSPIETAAGFQYYWYASLSDAEETEFYGNNSDFTFTPSGPGTYVVDLYAVDSNDNEGFDEVDIPVVVAGGGPTVTVSDAGGMFNNTPYSATAMVDGADSLEGVSPTLTYYSGGSAMGTPLAGAPTAVGAYTVVADFAGSASFPAAESLPLTFDITQATPTVSVADAGGTYGGATFPATAEVAGVDNTPAASLEGISPTLIYYSGKTATGAPLAGAPSTAGTYTVVANFAGSTDYVKTLSTAITFNIIKATAPVVLSNLTQTYTGSPESPTATTTPTGLAVTFSYMQGTTVVTNPTNAGTYSVVATINDPNYQGSTTGNLTIIKATAPIVLSNLTQTYTGSPESPTATTTPTGLAVTFSYMQGTTVVTNPTNAGTYSVVATINDPNYQGSTMGNLTIIKATAPIVLSNLTQTYTGSPESPTATTTPTGLAVTFSYMQGTTVVTNPTNAGAYSVVATINDPNYQGNTTGNLTIIKATAPVVLSNLTQTYTGSPESPTATTTPTGLAVTFSYMQGTTVVTNPTNAGTYSVVATINDPNYQGSTTGNLTINKATASVTLSNLAQTATGSPEFATVTTSPLGLAVTVVYTQGTTVVTSPTNTGTYSVTATVNDPNYQGSASGNLVISSGTTKATATIVLGNLNQTYTGSPEFATATTTPTGLQVILVYTQGATVVTSPTSAGTYTVVATINDPSYQGSTTGSLVIAKATAKITLGNLAQTYSGSPEYATATTVPAGLAVTIVYKQGNTVVAKPTNVGSYSVTATVNNSNYTATTATGTLVIKGVATLANLSAPTIIYHTPCVTLGGTISGVAGAPAPTGTVTITVFYAGKQKASQTVTLRPGCAFATTFLSVFGNIGQYTLVYSYSGDANYAATSSTVIGTVTYCINPLFSQTSPTKAGGTVAVKVALDDVYGANVGSSSEALTVVGIAPASSPKTTTSLPAGNAAAFTYSQGVYTLNLKTTGLKAGTYLLYFLAAGDTVLHSVQFTLS